MSVRNIFEVTEAVEGGYDARALGYSIFTQGEDWADLKAMVKDSPYSATSTMLLVSVPSAFRLRPLKKRCAGAKAWI